jgi:hypothetical protein
MSASITPNPSSERCPGEWHRFSGENATKHEPRERLPVSLAAECASEHDDFGFANHHALGSWWSMIFSENRFPLFGIML